MSTTWTNAFTKDPSGVTVLDVDGRQINYPTAARFEVDPDGSGALHIIAGDAHTGEEVKALHAPGRWNSAVVHGPAPKPVQVTITDSTGAVIARSSFDSDLGTV